MKKQKLYILIFSFSLIFSCGKSSNDKSEVASPIIEAVAEDQSTSPVPATGTVNGGGTNTPPVVPSKPKKVKVIDYASQEECTAETVCKLTKQMNYAYNSKGQLVYKTSQFANGFVDKYNYTSVSYTHLDVYKRQQLISVCSLMKKT